ncbi:MAG: PH domain-containing protein [Bacteroidota bacterium]
MGSYVNNNLLKDEQVMYETKYHWKIFFTLSGLFTLFVVPALKRWSDEFVITNRRVIIKTGIFARSTFEMNLNKIESVNVDQSIFGRMFGYGTITIIGTGGTKESFTDIARAVEFRKNFQEVSS